MGEDLSQFQNFRGTYSFQGRNRDVCIRIGLCETIENRHQIGAWLTIQVFNQVQSNCGQRLDISLKPWAAIEGCEQYLLFEGRDITELMEQQEQLRQSERLRALGQLSSGIAHEFNNLLLLISANADLMQQKLPSGEGRLYTENCERKMPHR